LFISLFVRQNNPEVKRTSCQKLKITLTSSSEIFDYSLQFTAQKKEKEFTHMVTGPRLYEKLTNNERVHRIPSFLVSQVSQLFWSYRQIHVIGPCKTELNARRVIALVYLLRPIFWLKPGLNVVYTRNFHVTSLYISPYRVDEENWPKFLARETGQTRAILM